MKRRRDLLWWSLSGIGAPSGCADRLILRLPVKLRKGQHASELISHHIADGAYECITRLGAADIVPKRTVTSAGILDIVHPRLCESPPEIEQGCSVIELSFFVFSFNVHSDY